MQEVELWQNWLHVRGVHLPSCLCKLQRERPQRTELDPTEIPGAQVSKFGVIPKSGQPGKWRLILNLSSPQQYSVNDGIDRGLCSLTYISVDEAVQTILRMGRGAQLAEVDIEHTYRNVPVHPDDRPLLCMNWQANGYGATIWASVRRYSLH